MTNCPYCHKPLDEQPVTSKLPVTAKLAALETKLLATVISGDYTAAYPIVEEIKALKQTRN